MKTAKFIRRRRKNGQTWYRYEGDRFLVKLVPQTHLETPKFAVLVKQARSSPYETFRHLEYYGTSLAKALEQVRNYTDINEVPKELTPYL